MTEQDVSFEHHAAFEQGELSGQVRLGKFEANYEELFAEAIEDGVITHEERARLNRAADALGLDRSRLRRLEEALQAAYEARHRVRVREMTDDLPPPASLVVVPEAAKEASVGALQRRVAELEAQVATLTQELEQARSQVAVEVDLSDVGVDGSPTPAAEESIEELARRVRSDPRDPAPLHALCRAYRRSDGDADRQWLIAQALVYLGAADEDERLIYARGRKEGLIKPTSSLSAEGWRLLYHPDEELLTGQIFAVIVPAVLIGRVSTLRRDKTLIRLDPELRQDPARSTLQGVRCFAWAGAILGTGLPPLYAYPDYPGLVEMVPGVPPATRLGTLALSGRSPLELAFVAGRHLSWYREEHFIRLLVASIPDLEDLFLAALSIARPAIPLAADITRRVAPLARAIEPVLEPAAVDRLRGHFLRFLEDGGRTNLQRWASAAERTAARAGLLLANDLHAAAAIFALEEPGTVRDKMDDLIVFVTSDRYAKLRKQIGLA
jgi:polyhydroxyalkanoate synthesis regulator phasin